MHYCNQYTYLTEQLCLHDIWNEIDVDTLFKQMMLQKINVKGKEITLVNDFGGILVKYKEKSLTLVSKPKLIHFNSFNYQKDKIIYGVEEFENELKTYFTFPIYLLNKKRETIVGRAEIIIFFNSEADTIIEESFSFLTETDYEVNQFKRYMTMNEKDNFYKLTTNYEYYYDNELKSDHLLNLNNERKQFNLTILNFLYNKEHLLCIAGPYGIGKTTSLLYYQKMNPSFKILYFNLKKMILLFNEHATRKQDILKITINEIIRISDSYQEFSQLNHYLAKYYTTSRTMWSFLVQLCTDIINYCQSNNQNIVIIFDQYKQKYDEYYTNLKSLLELNQNNGLKIIISSSINDSDTGLTIKSEWLNDNSSILHYHLFGTLIDNEIITNRDNLSKELKDCLEQFNYLPNIYYEIKEKNIVNDKEIEAFTNTKKRYIYNKINEFYRNDSSVMFWAIKSIKENIRKPLEKSDFLKLIDFIPLKYITVKQINHYFILDYHFLLIKTLFEEIYFNLLKLNKYSIKPNKKEITMSGEDFELLITQTIKNEGFISYKINRIIKVNSVIDLIELYNNNIIENDYYFSEILDENILFVQTSENDKRYELAILIYTEGKYKFCLLQISKFKTYSELLYKSTIKEDCRSISFNLRKNYNIKVEEKDFYFFYIFLEETKRNSILNALKSRGIAWLTYSNNDNCFINNNYNNKDAHVFDRFFFEERSRYYQLMTNIKSMYSELEDKKEQLKMYVELNEEYSVELSNKDIDTMKNSIAQFFLINIQRINYYSNSVAMPHGFLPSQNDEIVVINELSNQSQFILKEASESNDLEKDVFYNCKEGIITTDDNFRQFYEMTIKNKVVRYYFFSIDKPYNKFRVDK